jgi:hypothetical protein
MESSVSPELSSSAMPIVDRDAKKRARFKALVEQWQIERGAQSSITAAAMMPAYQSIIGMGEDAVPFIIAQLEAEGDDPDQWFWALRAITGVDPVDASNRGNFQAMARAWISWSESHHAR